MNTIFMLTVHSVCYRRRQRADNQCCTLRRQEENQHQQYGCAGHAREQSPGGIPEGQQHRSLVTKTCGQQPCGQVAHIHQVSSVPVTRWAKPSCSRKGLTMTLAQSAESECGMARKMAPDGKLYGNDFFCLSIRHPARPAAGWPSARGSVPRAGRHNRG